MPKKAKSYHDFLHAFVNALILSLLFISIPVFISVTWETNDDTAIALLLSYSDNDFSPFQWNLLSQIIHFLNITLPVIDWWAVSSIFAIWLGAFAACFVIFRRYPYGHSLFVSVGCLIVLYFSAVYRVNFTRTAIAVAMPGCMLIADSIFSSKKSWKDFAQYVLGCFLLLYGASIRESSALITLGFLAVIGFVRLIADYPVFTKEWLRSHLRQIAMLCLTAVIFFSASKINSICLTPEEKEYLDYNKLRAALQDYSSMYPSYDSAEEVYQEIGLDKTTHQLLFGWASEDTALMTVEKMEKVAELKEETSSFDLIVSGIQNNRFAIILTLAFFCLLSVHRRQNWIRNLVVIDVLIIVLIYLAYFRGRLPSRVLMPSLWAAMCTSIFLSGSDDRLSRSGLCDFWCGYDAFIGNNLNWLKRLWVIAVCMAFIMLSVVSFWHINTLIKADTDPAVLQEQEENRRRNREFYDYIQENPENLYIFDIYHEPMTMRYAFSFWEHRPVDYGNNRFGLGGWGARHPYRINLLREYGIINPYVALYNHPDVCTTYSQRVINHLRANYNSQLVVSGVGDIQGNPIVKYSVPINENNLMDTSEDSVFITEFKYIPDYSGHNCWYLEAEISTSSLVNRHFYCNITVDGIRLTYALAHENEKIYAYLYDIDETLDLREAELSILELNENGNYVELATQLTRLNLLPSPSRVRK